MALGDSLTTGIAIVAATAIMLVAPMIMVADKTDSIAQSSIQTATTNFNNEILTSGKITQDAYDNFILTLAATDNAYDVEITVQKLDQNPAKKQSGSDTIGDSVYTTYYTTQVVDHLPFIVNEGDLVSVKVQSKSETIFTQLTGADSKLVAEASGMVTYNGSR